MVNIKTLRLGTLNNKRKLLNLIAAAILVLAVFLVVYNKVNHKSDPMKAAGENRSAAADNNLLQNHDYTGYQSELTLYADVYTGDHRYSDAERVLNTIVQNVPKDQINSSTYRSFWYLYQQKGDAQNRKKYALLTAEKLKQEGQPQAAAAFEKDAAGQ